MNRFVKVSLLAAGLATAGLVGYGAGSMGAHAQPGPGGGQGMGPGMMMERGFGPAWGGPGGGHGPHRGEWGRGGPHRSEWGRGGPHGGEWGRGGPHRGDHARGPGGPLRGFFINRDNKNLSNDDVRKIAEAGLLWYGERSWRIGEVKDAGFRAAEFTVTTADGGVIARFIMDRDTGRVRRVG